MTKVLDAPRSAVYSLFFGFAVELVGDDNSRSFVSETVSGGRTYCAAAASYNYDLAIKTEIHVSLLSGCSGKRRKICDRSQAIHVGEGSYLERPVDREVLADVDIHHPA